MGTEGYVQLQTGTAVSWTPQFPPNANRSHNIITYGMGRPDRDPTTNAGSSVRYFVNGTSPNRVLVITSTLRYLGGIWHKKPQGRSGYSEVDNHIEVALTNINDNGTSRTKTLGIENNTGSLGLSLVGKKPLRFGIPAMKHVGILSACRIVYIFLEPVNFP